MPTPRLLFSSAAFFGRPSPTPSARRRHRLRRRRGHGHPRSRRARTPPGCGARRGARAHDRRDPRPVPPRHPADLGRRSVAKIDRAVEVASDAEVPVVVMHPPYRWQTRLPAWLEDTLPTLEERTGVTVAIENMFPLRVGNRRHASTRTRTSTTSTASRTSSSTRATPRWPTTTSSGSGSGFGDRLRHVHLSDNLGRGWDNHLPPGDGVLPLDDSSTTSPRASYDGSRLARGRPPSGSPSPPSACARDESRCASGVEERRSPPTRPDGRRRRRALCGAGRGEAPC